MGLCLVPHLQPMGEVVPHVVATKREHRKGVVTEFADHSSRSCSHLRRDTGADKCPMLPTARLKDQGNYRRAPASKEHPRNGNTLGIFPSRIHGWTLGRWSCETAVGMGGFLLGTGGPLIAAPIGQLRGRSLCHPLPPDVA